MRVLVTGAGGNLGRVLVPALRERGHTVRAADVRPLDVDAERVELDVRDADAVARVMDGVDAVVHGAALHGVHLARFPPHEFWQTNATGTFNVYDAARAAGVGRVVLSSTMAVYGASAEGRDDAWAVVTEESPLRPKDVYGLSKLVCEEIAREHAREHAIVTVALRLGMFVPETFERYGFRLLFGGVDDRDVAGAFLRALEHDPSGGFDAFDVMADTPFGPEEAAGIAADAATVLERHWPGVNALARERGQDVRELVWGWALWPVDKAKRELGYKPRFGFAEFLDAWRGGDAGYYPFAGLAQWGVDTDAA